MDIPFNTLLNTRVPIVWSPLFNTSRLIPLFNKYPALILGAFFTAPCIALLPDFVAVVWIAPCIAPYTVPLLDFATAVWTAPCTPPWVLGAWVILTGVFAVFLCIRSDFPRGRELDNWFGYRFFEVVRLIPRSMPHYGLSSSVA